MALLTIKNIKNFSTNIVQEGCYFCIPACIECILKYHNYKPDIPQFDIMVNILKCSTDCSPSLMAADVFINNQLNRYLTSKHITPITHVEWKNIIKDNISKNNPVVFTTRIKETPHVRIIIGYDDSDEYFLIFDPGKTLYINPKNINGYDIGELVICSDVYKYSYNESEIKWTEPYSCHDLLLIEKNN